MNACDPFRDVKTMDFDEAVEQGLVKWIGDEVLDAYYDAVADKSVNNLTDEQIATLRSSSSTPRSTVPV